MKGIYKITNPSGAIYIGQSDNINNRKNKYKNANCKDQQYIYRSIKKYGFENHKFEILTTLPDETDKEYMNFWEEMYIQKYRSNCSRYPNDNGMNLNDGGGGNKGYKMSNESKKKMSESKINIPRSEETKDKLRKAHLGKINEPHSEETKIKIGKSNKDKTRSEEVKIKMRKPKSVEHKINNGKSHKKIINQLDINRKLIKEWPGVIDASTELKIDKSDIANCARGKKYSKSAGGFIWEYKN